MSHSVFGSGFRRAVIAISAVIALAIGVSVVPVRALPTSVNLIVHYYRDNGDFGGQAGGTGPWNMWIWKDAPGAADDVAVNAPAGNPFKDKTSTTKDTWGYAGSLNMTITGFTPVQTQIGFIIRQGLWDDTDIGFDRFVTNIDPVTGKAEVWLKQGDKTVYTSVPRLGPAIKSASVDDFRKITVNLNRAAASGTSASNFSLCPIPSPTATPAPGSPAIDPPAPTSCSAGSGGTPTISSVTFNTSTTATLTLGSDVTLGKNYYVLLKDKNNIDFGSQKTYSGKILTSDTFNANYVYNCDTCNDLGYTYSQANTKFRIWAPTATNVKVRLYGTVAQSTASPKPTPVDVQMTKDVKGTWVATASGDQNGQIYMYRVSVDGRVLDAVDPYARATTINGGQSVVADLNSTNPTGFTTETKPAFSGKLVDASVYELHVRDLSMDSTSGYPADQKGKFSALTNFNTTYCGVASPAPTVPAKPATPTGLKATAGVQLLTSPSPASSASPSRKPVVRLQWAQTTGATGYKIFRGTTMSPAPSVQLATSTSNGYTDAAVVANSTYYYTVKATNKGGDSLATVPVSVKPVATATPTAYATPIPVVIPPAPSASPWVCPSSATVKTGMGFIKDLGVTHVQLQPVYDFGSVNEASPTFNWGYDPQNPNVPEGSYSSNASNPTTRINELKAAVQAMHANGIRVVMDVIYNHVMNPNTFSVESIVPGYFFRTDALGNLTNASGCGNDVASERPMVRKYIVDSVKYWAKEYHMDGFRFDIMSLIDKDTMKQVSTELKKIDSTTIVLGEGWTYDATKAQISLDNQSRQANAGYLPDVAFFNDQMRDGTKGDTGNDVLGGYVNGWPDGDNVRKVINGIAGQTAAQLTKDTGSSRSWTASSPGQSVNYVEVHDGLTLWDKLNASNTAGYSAAVLKKMDQQAASIVFLSQGMPFIQAGQEFLRTKKGEANSYAPPQSVTATADKLAWELNTSALKWNLAYTNKAVADYYKGLIQLRKQHPLFRLDNTGAIDGRYKWAPAVTGSNTLGFYYDQGSLVGDTWSTIAVGINPNGTDQTLTLPNSGTWYVVVNGTAAGTNTITTFTGNKVTIPANSTVVVRQ